MPNDHLNTTDLVQNARDGEPRALDELLERYYPRVMKIVRLRMGTRLRRRMDSRDVLQETFSRAMLGFDHFEMRNEASLINWLSKITENTISDLNAKESAQKRDVAQEVSISHDEESASAPIELEAGWVVPLDRMIRNEEIGKLESAVESLDPTYRELIILRNYVGLSFAEIATETGRPSEGAARMMHAKAMRELARRVTADPNES